MAALTVVPPSPPAALSLYDTEAYIAALADTAELVPPEMEAEFLAEFRAGLVAAADKRDRVAHFLTHLEAQAALAAAEIKRLQERKAFFERAAERLEQYVLQVIEGLGLDGKGKAKKLEGNTTTMSSRACPASVNVTDEALVPAIFKSVTVTLPALAWEGLIDGLDIDAAAKLLDQIKKPAVAISKSLVKAAFDAGEVIAGACLITDKKTLVRK